LSGIPSIRHCLATMFFIFCVLSDATLQNVGLATMSPSVGLCQNTWIRATLTVRIRYVGLGNTECQKLAEKTAGCILGCFNVNSQVLFFCASWCTFSS
jgi:hypothetical protein